MCILKPSPIYLANNDKLPLTAARVAHLFSILQDSGDDTCCHCARPVADKESSEASNNGLAAAAVSKCGHV